MHHLPRPLALLLLIPALLLPACTTSPAPDYVSSQTQAMAQLLNEPLQTQLWDYGQIPGTKISTPHYRIYTTLRNTAYQHLVAKVLEADYARFIKANPTVTAAGPFDCYVFGDRPQWEYFTRRRMGSNSQIYLQISAGGYCQEGVFAGYDIGREQTLSVIAHEAWHQFSWFAFKDRLPSWLEEGLATQNEAIDWNGTTPVFTPQNNLRRYNALRDAIQQHRLWPLAELTPIHAGQAIRRQERDIDAYYAQLWSLTLFIQHSKYKPGLDEILRRATNGTLTDALKNTPAQGLSQFTERWNQLAGPIYLHAYISPNLPQFEKDYRHFINTLISTWPPKLPN